MNQEIIKRFKSFGHPQSIKKFFDLLNELITEVNISADNPRLALNVRNDYRKRISVSINSRLVLSLRENTPVPLLGFMLPEGLTEKEVPNHIEILKGDPFANSTENFYEFKYDDLYAFNEKLKQKWIADCREYLPSQKSSQYRKHHIPELYDMAADNPMLNQYLEKSGYELENAGQMENLPEEYSQWHPLVKEYHHDLKERGYAPSTCKYYPVNLQEQFDIIVQDKRMSAHELIDYTETNIKRIEHYLGRFSGEVTSRNFLLAKAHRSYWALGFNSSNEDLKHFKKEDVWHALHYDRNDTSQGARTAFRHFEKIKVDDYVIIKGHGGSNDLRVHYAGMVKEKDEEKKVLTFFKRDIQLYKGKAPSGHGAGNWRNTIVPVTRPDDIKLLFATAPVSDKTEKIEEESVDTETLTTKAMNLILYGPPGTGKTYSTKAYALSLLRDGTAHHLEEFAQLREHDKANFNRQWLHHKQSDQVEFVTFHQSFSYEDFVQGIRPDVEADGVKFQRVDGIFKTICTNALFEYYKLKWVEESNATRKWAFDELWIDFTGLVLKTTDDPYPLETKSGGTIYLDSFSNSGNFRLRHENKSRKYTVSMFRMNKIFNAFNSVDDINNVHDDIRSVIGGANTSTYWAVFNALKKYEAENEPWEELTPDDLDSYEYEERKKRVQNLEDLRRYTDQKVPQYVLIVDEINRANISRVLGELITLLEPDKRLGQHDELIVKLPSGESFAVPPNLHIIGTMNTADKSIAHLDVALRRRFQFISMYPDLSKVTNDQKRQLLEQLNKFIVEMRSPELSIGHSYFMNEDSIESIMNNKVIPLLNEYFDYRTDEVREILEKASLAVSKDAYGQLTCLGYNELESEKGAH